MMFRSPYLICYQQICGVSWRDNALDWSSSEHQLVQQFFFSEEHVSVRLTVATVF